MYFLWPQTKSRTQCEENCLTSEGLDYALRDIIFFRFLQKSETGIIIIN